MHRISTQREDRQAHSGQSEWAGKHPFILSILFILSEKPFEIRLHRLAQGA
jgi:hypothetical protein